MTRFQKSLKLAKQAAKHSFKNPYVNSKYIASGLSDFYAFRSEVYTSSAKKMKIAMRGVL